MIHPNLVAPRNLQSHAALMAAGASPLRVSFSNSIDRAEWIVVHKSRFAAASAGVTPTGTSGLLRSATRGEIIVGPATPWEAESTPALSLRVSACPVHGAPESVATGPRTVLLRVYYLPAGARVYATSPAARSPGAALDASPEAMGLGDSFSQLWSVAVPLPVLCELTEVKVQLAGAVGYTGTLLQLGLALDTEETRVEISDADGVVLSVASIEPLSL